MDHDNAGGVVSGGCDGCGHNSCDFDLILPLTFEERYTMHKAGFKICQRSITSIGCRWNRLDFYSSIVSPALASIQPIRLSKNLMSGIQFDL